ESCAPPCAQPSNHRRSGKTSCYGSSIPGMAAAAVIASPRWGPYSLQATSGSLHAAVVQQPVDVEHHQQLVVEPVDAERVFAKLRIEGRGVALPFRAFEGEHFADRIDHQAIQFAVVLGHDAHRA